jgi:hypothetical protein
MGSQRFNFVGKILFEQLVEIVFYLLPIACFDPLQVQVIASLAIQQATLHEFEA